MSAGGIVVRNGEVVIVFQKDSQTWYLPKGHIKEGETIKETAKREIYEECGVNELNFVKELGSYVRGTKSNPNIKKKITFLHFTTTQTNLNPVDPDNPKAKWVLIDDIRDYLFYESDKNFFLKIKHLL